MIERLPVGKIMPTWSNCIADRYVSHPIEMRVAIIQMVDEPESVYCVSDEMLPNSIATAREIVRKFRDAEARSEE